MSDTLPEEILRQTFQIRTPHGTGTAFTIEVADRQYIVTAQHVLGSASPEVLEIQVDETGWRKLPVTVIGMEGPPVDVAVLATDSMLGSRSGVSVGAATVGYGQDVRFLGYPFGWEFTPVPEFRDSPLPFIKAGILSALVRKTDVAFHLLVDATGNPGFSGGPLVLPRRLNKEDGVDWHIVGVVTNAAPHRYEGIVHAISIDAAKRMIRENPAGYPLPEIAGTGRAR